MMTTRKLYKVKSKIAFSVIEVMISISIIVIAIFAMMSTIPPMRNAGVFLKEQERASEIANLMLERFQGASWHKIGVEPWAWHRAENAETDATRAYVDQLGVVPTTASSDFKHRPIIDQPTSQYIYKYLQDPNTDGVPDDKILTGSFNRDQWGTIVIDQSHSDAYNSGNVNAGLDPKTDPSVPGLNAAVYNDAERYNWIQYLGLLNEPSGLENMKIYVEFYTMALMEDSHTRAERNANMLLPAYQLSQAHVHLDLTTLPDMERDSIVIRVFITWTDRTSGLEMKYERFLARRR